MIPRVKVNYTLGTLVGAAWKSLRRREGKPRLCQLLSELFGCANVMLTPSGRGGLYFLLKASERRKVIVPAYTCKAVVEAALLAGKEVVFVKTEPHGVNLDPSDVARKCDSDSIILATHQFGIPCRIRELLEIAESCGALVIEDAAASFGSRVDGELTGTRGHAAFFSFDSTKTINVPLKGGFIIIRESAYFDQVMSLYHTEIQPAPLSVSGTYFLAGLVYLALKRKWLYRIFHMVNFRMRGRFTADGPAVRTELTSFYRFDLTDWQANVALTQVESAEQIYAARGRLYERYVEEFSCCQSFSLPPAHGEDWVCTRFPIFVRDHKQAFYRSAVRKGVDLAFSFTFIAAPKGFERAHRIAGEILNLPYYPQLGDEDFRKVVSAVRRIDEEMGICPP